MLRYKADRRTLGFVAAYFALLVTQWIWSPSDWYLAAPLFLATCCFSWFCAVITHNAIHCTLFESRNLNRAFQVVLTLTYGHPVSSYVSGHNLSHHLYTQEDRDVMRTTKMRFRWNLLNLLFFFPTIGGRIFRDDFAFAKQMRKEKPRWFRQFMLELVVFGVVSVVLLVLDWRKFLVYWYIPHFWAAWGIVTINYLQHDGCDQASAYNHSRNFTSRVFGWWTFNNGYHAVHHMRPNLHWSLLPEVHAREVRPHMHPALEQPSIVAYAWRAFIWPARRVRYDGTPMTVPAKMDDQPWIPSVRREDLPPDALGAET